MAANKINPFFMHTHKHVAGIIAVILVLAALLLLPLPTTEAPQPEHTQVSETITKSQEQFSLSDLHDETGLFILDQQMRKTDLITGVEEIVIESVHEVLPGLRRYEALFEIARPEGSALVIYTIHPSAVMEGVRGGELVAYDPTRNTFLPRLQESSGQRFISPNQRYAIMFDTDEARESRSMVLYDFVQDKRTVLETLPEEETFTKNHAVYAPIFEVSWVENAAVTYTVFSSEQPSDGFEYTEDRDPTRVDTIRLP
jgi:hypothetical protein